MSISNKGILKETFIYSIGSFGSKVLSFFLLPLYTFFLSKEDLGQYDLFITTLTLFVPLVSLQVSDSAYRWLVSSENQINNASKIITNSLFIFIISYIVFSILFGVYLFFENFSYSSFFLVLLFFSCLLPFFQSILRGLGRTKDFAANGIVTTFLMVIFNFLFIYVFKLKVEGILIANIIANAISVFLIFIKLKIYKFIHVNFIDYKLIKNLLHYSLPLIPNLMSWWLIGSASKFIILHFMGSDANGIYAVSSRFPSILVIINSVLVLPIQDAYLKDNSSFDFFKNYIKRFTSIQFSLVFILALGAPIYTKYVVDKAFYESWQYMPFLYMGVAFNTLGALVSMVYLKEKKTLRITVTTLIGGAGSILLSYLLIPKIGLQGVSLSYFLGFLVMFLLRLWDAEKKYSFEFNYLLIIGLLLLFTVTIFIEQKINFFYQTVICAISILIIIMTNFEMIINLLKKINLKKN